MNHEIWVWAEQQQGKIPSVVFELLGKGKELADKLNGKLAVVLLADKKESLVEELFHYGVERIYVVEGENFSLYNNEDFTATISELIKEYNPYGFFFGGTPDGMELAARVAARIRTGLTAHCVDLEIVEHEGQELIGQIVPGFGDSILVKIITPVARPQMATVRPGVFTEPEKTDFAGGEVIEFTGGPQIIRKTRMKKLVEKGSGEFPLDDAENVVVAGFGLHSAGGLNPAMHLAKELDAVVGGTRPVVDKGWLPEEVMVGQSGRMIKPKLLITLGASGAMHFTTGITRAKITVAVDRNANAPIFKFCDIGIVGDLNQVVPALIQELQIRKAGEHG